MEENRRYTRMSRDRENSQLNNGTAELMNEQQEFMKQLNCDDYEDYLNMKYEDLEDLVTDTEPSELETQPGETETLNFSRRFKSRASLLAILSIPIVLLFCNNISYLDSLNDLGSHVLPVQDEPQLPLRYFRIPPYRQNINDYRKLNSSGILGFRELLKFRNQSSTRSISIINIIQNDNIPPMLLALLHESVAIQISNFVRQGSLSKAVPLDTCPLHESIICPFDNSTNPKDLWGSVQVQDELQEVQQEQEQTQNESSQNVEYGQTIPNSDLKEEKEFLTKLIPGELPVSTLYNKLEYLKQKFPKQNNETWMKLSDSLGGILQDEEPIQPAAITVLIPPNMTIEFARCFLKIIAYGFNTAFKSFLKETTQTTASNTKKPLTLIPNDVKGSSVGDLDLKIKDYFQDEGKVLITEEINKVTSEGHLSLYHGIANSSQAMDKRSVLFFPIQVPQYLYSKHDWTPENAKSVAHKVLTESWRGTLRSDNIPALITRVADTVILLNEGDEDFCQTESVWVRVKNVIFKKNVVQNVIYNVETITSPGSIQAEGKWVTIVTEVKNIFRSFVYNVEQS